MSTNPESESVKTDNPPKPIKISPLVELLWAAIGLLLTILSTFLGVFITNPPWEWLDRGIYAHSLGITYQVGAVLLTGCLGGKNAGILAQIAYLILGLAWLPIFGDGGGWDYWQRPTFGYLLGFIPGAGICGWLAFQYKPKIERFALSSLAGLGIIHACGILYLILLTLLKPVQPPILTGSTLPEAILHLSILALPGQIILICLTSVLAFLIRKAVFY